MRHNVGYGSSPDSSHSGRCCATWRPICSAERLKTICRRPRAAAVRREADHPGAAGRLHARRQVLRQISDKTVVKKLFDTLDRFAARPGGYHPRPEARAATGDGADMAIVELVGSERPSRSRRTTRRRAAAARPRPRRSAGRAAAARSRLRTRAAKRTRNSRRQRPAVGGSWRSGRWWHASSGRPRWRPASV